MLCSVTGGLEAGKHGDYVDKELSSLVSWSEGSVNGIVGKCCSNHLRLDYG